jgi:hypothetical protein
MALLDRMAFWRKSAASDGYGVFVDLLMRSMARRPASPSRASNAMQVSACSHAAAC